MAEAAHKTADRPRETQRKVAEPAQAPEESAALAVEPPSLTAAGNGDDAAARHAAALRDPRLREVGSLQRARMIQQLQRGYGNSHVERVLARVHDLDATPIRRRESGTESTAEDRPPTEAEKAAALKAAAAAEQAAQGTSTRGADQTNQAQSAKASEHAAGQAAKQKAHDASNQARAAKQAGHAAKHAGAKPSARNTGESAAEPAPAASATAPSGRAPASPDEDPAFQAGAGKITATGKRERTHASAHSKAAAAQAAAESPAAELSGKSQASQVGKMQQAETPAFDAAGFKARLMDRIASLAPKTAEEADSFKESDKVGPVKGEMQSGVAQEQNKSRGPLEQQTAAAPDPSAATPKPVIPLSAETPGAPPPAVGAERAAPKPKTPGEVETPIREESRSLDQDMAKEDITEQQLKESNEPEFQAAADAKGEAQANAATAPAEYRQAERDQLAQAQTEAAAGAQAETAAMHADRGKALQQVAGQQGQTKSKDEQARAQVGADIQAIYNETKANVEAKLNGLDAKVEQAFDQGAEAAKQTFENYVEARMNAYKERRYGGWFGWARWAKDKISGMPSEVNTFYDEGRKLYIREMSAVIDRVTAIIGTTLTEAKAEVARGKQRIAEYVAKLAPNLQQVGQEAADAMQDQFAALEDDIKGKESELIDTMARKYQDNLQKVDARINEMKEANKGLIQKAKDAIKGVIETIKKLKDMLLNTLAKAASVIGQIIKHPIKFLGNLIDAIKLGFNQFSAKKEEYVKKGLLGWLLGSLAETGIKLPENFDLKGILGLVLQLIGLTYENIRARAVKMVGEKTVQAIEKGAEIFKVLLTEGPAGLWKFIQDKLASLKEQVIEEVKDFVITKIITAGITWIISLFNPASAFIKACKMIYDVVMFFIERGSQIMELVNSILDSIGAIASGAIGTAANLVEQSLGKAIPIAISFLASLLGVGGIAGKVRGAIEKIQKPINTIIDKLIGGVVKGFKKLKIDKLVSKIKSGAAIAKKKVKQAAAYVKAKAKQGVAWAKTKVQQGKDWVKGKAKGVFGKDKEKLKPGETEQSADVKAAVKAALTSQANKEFTNYDEVNSIISGIYSKYSSKGLKSIQLVPKKGKIDVIVTASPPSAAGALIVKLFGPKPENIMLNLGVFSKETHLFAPFPGGQGEYKSKSGIHAEMFFIQDLRNNMQNFANKKLSITMRMNRTPCPDCASELIKVKRWASARFKCELDITIQATNLYINKEAEFRPTQSGKSQRVLVEVSQTDMAKFIEMATEGIKFDIWKIWEGIKRHSSDPVLKDLKQEDIDKNVEEQKRLEKWLAGLKKQIEEENKRLKKRIG